VKRYSAFLFACFASAQILSLYGDRLNQLALVGLVGKTAPGSSFELFKLTFFMHLPLFTLAPLIGAYLDRMDKRWAMVYADLFRGCVVLVIPLLFARGGELAPLYTMVYLLYAANLFFAPAKSALVPEFVQGEALMRANSFLWAAGIVGTLAGFFTGGVLFRFVSWQWCFYIDAITYFISVAILFYLATRLRPVRRSTRRQEALRRVLGFRGLWREIVAGLRLIRSDNDVKITLGSQVMISAASGALYVAAIALVQSAQSTFGLSLVGVSLGLGMIVGTAMTGTLRRLVSPRYIMVLGFLVCGISLVLFSRSLTLKNMMLAAAVGGLAATPILVLTETLIQERVPPDIRGRIFTSREVLTRSAFLISAFLAAVASGYVRKQFILVVTGLVLAWTALNLERKAKDL
jgi:DHA3 family macrolide efflux protein-like MFS transporter